MASFPDSVKSFTTKNAADVIQAAHVNDLQDEVNAIESGLLSGTARIVSSGASVLGQSTFASRPVMPPPEAVYVYLASSVTIGSSAASTIAWDAQYYMTNSSMHSLVSNQSRLVPQSTGIFQVMASLVTSSNSTGYVEINIRDSSAGLVCHGLQAAAPTSSDAGHYNTVTGLKRFDVLGGYLVCVLSPSGPSTLSIEPGLGRSFMAMHKL